MMRYRLRTLIVMVALTPPVLAAGWSLLAGAADPLLLVVGGYLSLVLLVVMMSALVESSGAQGADSEEPAMPGKPGMPPEFTAEEQYLIHFYKGAPDESLRDALGNEGTHLLPVVIMVGLAFYLDSLVLAASATLVYAVLKIREAVHGPRWRRVTRSIFLKYERALAGRGIDEGERAADT